MRKILLALPFIFIVSACGVDSGEVVDKNYEPAHTIQVEEDVYEQECEWENRSTRRADGTTRRERVYECENEKVGTEMVDKEIDDEWTFTLENEDGDTGEVEVDEGTYEEYAIGEFYEK